jgi:hypothetical protein
MRRPGGCLIITDPDPPRGQAQVREIDTVTCAHCQFIIQVPPGVSPADLGGWCFRCAAPVCGPCAEAGGCRPWEAQMERIEARERLRRAVGV